MRGRLFFYSFWHQEARAYLAEFAARQYTRFSDFSLTHDLRLAIEFFQQLLENTAFINGVAPEKFFNRKTTVLYTDGSYEGDGITKPIFKGIGGVAYHPDRSKPWFYEDQIHPLRPNFEHIAVIEMFAIYRALQLFAKQLSGSALILFCDNTHAIGCLLKRSASIREDESRRKASSSYFEDYSKTTGHVPLTIRHCMNFWAKEIWSLVTKLDIVLWIEYVNTKVNIADLPSRQEPLPFPATNVQAI